jgi:hypothetical protein
MVANKIAHQKIKELAVVKFLKDNLPNNDFIHNKSVGTSCTNGHLFPDILFDCIQYFLIVEIDEFRHRNKAYDCEQKRMHDVLAKLGLPCIFIRYNPDNKNSDKNVLLEKVKEYLNIESVTSHLNLEVDDGYFCKGGLKTEYLFY